MKGWVRLFRLILDDPVKCKNTEYFAVWIYLLLNATHKEYESVFRGKNIILKPGQLITGRKEIAKQWKLTDSKIQRILEVFVEANLITQETSNKNRLISILEWEETQGSEQKENEQMLEELKKKLLPLPGEQKPPGEEKKPGEQKPPPGEPPLNVQLIIEAWNSLGLGQIRSISNKRLASTRAIIKEYSLDDLIYAMALIKESDFLQGQNQNGWVINYDWLINPDKFMKVLEGRYTNREIPKLNPAVTSGVPPKIKKFNAMLEHGFDFDELDELERAYIEAKLKRDQEERENGVNEAQ